VFWICFTFLIISLCLSFLLYRGELFNPMIIFFSVWSVALFLFQFNEYLQYFYYPLTDPAKVLMIVSFASFLLACVTFSLYPRVARGTDTMRVPDRDISRIVSVTKGVLLLFSLAVLIKYVILFRRYGNPFPVLDSVRNDFFAGELQYPAVLTILTTFGYIAILNASVLVIFHRSKRTILLTIWAFMLFWLNDSTTAMRGSFFNASLLFLGVMMITNSAKGRKSGMLAMCKFGALLLSFVALLSVIFYFRSGGDVTYIEGFTVHNYKYIVGDIPAYSYVVEHPLPSRVFGQETLLGLYQLLDIPLSALGSPLLDEAANKSVYVKIGPYPFNSYAYLAYFYSDFGDIGVAVCSFLMGAISTILFARALRKKRIVDIQFAAIAMVSLIHTYRGMYTNGRSFWIMLLLVIFQHVWLYRPRNQACETLAAGEVAGPCASCEVS
jgi:oligosaccharide repeat unit polymerase